MERHFKYVWYAHEGDINWDYYVPDIVCTCETPKIVWSGNYDKWRQENYISDPGMRDGTVLGSCLSEPLRCQCGRALRDGLHKCARCKSAYYNLFSHPFQLKEAERQRCWNCLEEAPGPLHNIYKHYKKSAPADWLLNPYVEPVSISDQLTQLDALLGNIDLSLINFDLGDKP